MIDFPIGELLDERICLIWLERHLHPRGLVCLHCGCSARRVCRAHGYVPAYHGRACEGDYTLLTGTVFETTRPRPATLVRLLRGLAKGEPPARLAREFGVSRTQRHTRRQRLQANLNTTAPTGVMPGTACEAAALDQHAGGKKPPHRDPTDPPRRRAHTRKGIVKLASPFLTLPSCGILAA